MKIVSSRPVSFGMFSEWLKIAYFGEEYFSSDVPKELVRRLVGVCKAFQGACSQRLVDGLICWYSTPLDFGVRDWGFSCPRRCTDAYLLCQHKLISRIYREYRIHEMKMMQNVLY